MATRKSWYKTFLNVVRRSTDFTFTNDRKVIAELDEFSTDIQLYFALHGMKAKFGDLIAPALSKGFTVDEAADQVEERIALMIATDEWNKSGEAGTPRLVFRAMAEHLPNVFDDAEAAAQAYLIMSEANQKVVREHLEIKALVKKYQLETANERAESAEETVDLESMFETDDDDDDDASEE